ncbi:MAG TPA: hypothetical protein VKR62_18185 [Roseiarcus sp.]|nr:hypothetical protein [Roseiarcus sp.]
MASPSDWRYFTAAYTRDYGQDCLREAAWMAAGEIAIRTGEWDQVWDRESSL